MPKTTKRASERIFYRRIENWGIWKLDWLWTAPSLVFCVLAFFPIALVYKLLSQT